MGRFDVLQVARTAHLLTPGRIAVPERLDPQTGAKIPSFRRTTSPALTAFLSTKRRRTARSQMSS